MKKFLNSTFTQKTKINLYFSILHRLDKLHAKRLSRFKNVKLLSINGNDHLIIKSFRDSGELKILINSIFS